MANEYASSSELKATLELSGQTFADADVALSLTAASRSIDHLTGRRYWQDPSAVARYYTPAASRVAWIDDLVTLTELAVDSSNDGAFAQTWTVNSDFVLEPLNAPADGWPWTTLQVTGRTAKSLPCHERSVRVTGRFGWSAVPDAIKQATMIVAAKLVKRSREAPFGVVALGMDGGAVRIASQDSEVAMLIGPYIRTNHC